MSDIAQIENLESGGDVRLKLNELINAINAIKGGLTGRVLVKYGDEDYEYEWQEYTKVIVISGVDYDNITPELGVMYVTIPPFS
jgi:hypothetical protein